MVGTNFNSEYQQSLRNAFRNASMCVAYRTEISISLTGSEMNLPQNILIVFMRAGSCTKFRLIGHAYLTLMEKTEKSVILVFLPDERKRSKRKLSKCREMLFTIGRKRNGSYPLWVGYNLELLIPMKYKIGMTIRETYQRLKNAESLWISSGLRGWSLSQSAQICALRTKRRYRSSHRAKIFLISTSRTALKYVWDLR